jgi:hypothetical protein
MLRDRLSALFLPKRVPYIRSRSAGVQYLREAYENLLLSRDQGTPRLAKEAEAAWHAQVAAFVASLIPYEEYVRELALLGLKGTPFTGDAYSEALANKLDVRIRILRPTNVALERRQLGRTTRHPDSGDVTVEIPVRLGRGWLYNYTLLHELGHVAAGHPPLPPDLDEATLADLEPPDERLARKAPLTSGLPKGALGDLYEAEAELRAQHGMLAGSLGELALGTERLNQVS